MRRKLLYTALIGSGLLAASLAAMIAFPGLWFRPAVLSRAAPFALEKAGFDLRADGWEASARWQDNRTVRFAVKLKDARLASQEGGLEAEASVLDVAVDLRWPALSLRMVAIPRLVARIERVKTGGGTEQPETDAAAEWRLPDPADYAFLPGFLREVRLGEIDLEAPSLELGTLGIDAGLVRSGDVLHARAREWKEGLGHAKLRVPLSPEGAFTGSAGGGELEATLAGKGRLAFGWKPAAGCQEKQTCIRGDGAWEPARRAGPRVKAGFDLRATERRWELALDGAIRDLTPLFGSLELRVPCRLGAEQATDGGDIDLSLGCAARAAFRWRNVLAGLPAGKLPRQGEVQLSGSAKLKDFGLPSASYAGKLSVDARPSIWPEVDSGFQLRSDFRGRMADGPRGVKQESVVTLNARVRDARQFAATLAGTPWAIPAPLNNLDGSLDLELVSRWKDLEAEAPLELTTALSSREQSLRTSAKGMARLALEPELSVHVQADVSLDDVRLSMPRLDLRELPRLFPASNIRRARTAQAAAGSSAFKYDLHVFTPPASPLRVDVNLLPEPIALDVDLRISDRAPPAIVASMRPLRFEVFRRQGTVETLRYTSSPARPHGDVDGRVRLKSGEYLVFARVYGRADRVRVQLTSEPAVGNDELWAILLFGEPMRELDADQQDSSQATARALSQGAFGLASLYVFARTPIERVSYDPLHQQVAVQFRLQEGTSLQVGHSEETSAEVGVRKRLGKGWSIDAKVTPGESDGDRDAQVGVGLEWSTRY